MRWEGLKNKFFISDDNSWQTKQTIINFVRKTIIKKICISEKTSFFCNLFVIDFSISFLLVVFLLSRLSYWATPYLNWVENVLKMLSITQKKSFLWFHFWDFILFSRQTEKKEEREKRESKEVLQNSVSAFSQSYFKMLYSRYHAQINI